MGLCEGKLKVKTAHFRRLTSASQKRTCLSSLLAFRKRWRHADHVTSLPEFSWTKSKMAGDCSIFKFLRCRLEGTFMFRRDKTWTRAGWVRAYLDKDPILAVLKFSCCFSSSLSSSVSVVSCCALWRSKSNSLWRFLKMWVVHSYIFFPRVQDYMRTFQWKTQ